MNKSNTMESISSKANSQTFNPKMKVRQSRVLSPPTMIKPREKLSPNKPALKKTMRPESARESRKQLIDNYNKIVAKYQTNGAQTQRDNKNEPKSQTALAAEAVGQDLANQGNFTPNYQLNALEFMKLRSQGDVLSQQDREEMLEYKDDVKFHIQGMKSPEQKL